jgi:hypothetical protein
MVSAAEIKKSQSSLNISLKAKQSGQLTENSCIFDLEVDGKKIGISVSLGLIFNKRVNTNFDVVSWYNSKSDIMKRRVSDLMYEIAFNKDFCQKWLKSDSQTSMMRMITASPVQNEDKNIISYLFEIKYDRF